MTYEEAVLAQADRMAAILEGLRELCEGNKDEVNWDYLENVAAGYRDLRKEFEK